MASEEAGGEMVTDEEVQEIIDQGEAGVGDLMEAYERAEAVYFSAVTPPQVVTRYATSTTTAC